MIVAGLIYLLLIGGDIGLVAAQGINGLFSSFILLAVPLFIFAAEVMTASNISDRLLQFVMMVVGRVRGGLAYVNIARQHHLRRHERQRARRCRRAGQADDRHDDPRTTAIHAGSPGR